ncbi:MULTISPECIES: glutathione transferase GstA [Arsenophonus]|uniref:glutathione transferase GstA n=1 Tax=Arsenophonus TaxID=637 RepID=UPI0015D8C8BB|nr:MULTISPECIES: glutathione transferase GstA [Arsenophonus]UBX30406.1 glutathione transferase GstA [Arsenophonus apicola]
MKLYYSAGACSLAPHIVLRETDLDFSIERVDLKKKCTEKDVDFYTINPKGQVPVLQLDNHDILTENAIILQYIADQAAGSNDKLIAPMGSLQRYHQLELVNYIATELHKGFSPLFSPLTPDNYREIVIKSLITKFSYIENLLAKRKFICGEHFTIADAYLFTINRWATAVNVDLSQYQHLKQYIEEKISPRKSVQEALTTEGLI